MEQKKTRYIKFALVFLLVIMLGTFALPFSSQRRSDEQPAVPVSEYAIGRAQAADEEEDPITEETVAVYVPSEDFLSASTYVQTITLSRYETVHEGAVKEILRSVRGVTGERPRPVNLYLLSFVKSDDIASVNFSGDTELSDSELFAIAYCVTNTLTEFTDVNYVNVLMDDKAVSVGGVPLGVMTYFTSSLQIEYWQFSNRAQALNEQSDIAASFSLPISLYYGTSTSLVVGEVRLIQCHADISRMIPPVIEELAKGPRDSGRARRLLPSDARLYSWETFEDDNGALSVKLNISGAVSSFFARNKIEPRVAVASIALSLFDFYPGLEQVSVYFMDGLQSEYSGITRPGCELLLGSTITLYFPPADGKSMVIPVERTVLSYMMAMPDMLLEEMMQAPVGIEVSGIFPPNTDKADIRSIKQQDDVAYVNISGNFLKELRACEPVQENNIVYCIVNTITDNKNVKKVVFLVDGYACDNVPGRINLSEPLYYNPGIIRRH